MLSKRDLWETFKPLVAAEGLVLYEIDLPDSSARGVLRIFLSRPKAPGTEQAVEAGESARAQGVGVEDCARVSRKVYEWIENECPELAECMLEVSSPGINRRLTRPEHYQTAVGERVKLKLRARSVEQRRAGQRAVIGRLAGFQGAALELEEEGSGAMLKVHLDDIQEARIDFRF